MLDQFLGQRDSLAPLLTALEASRRTLRPLPHALFLGGPGRGKTTLARAVAAETGKPFAVLHGSSTIERQTITDRILEASGGTLFIDEIHALPRQISEELYRVMDDGKLSISRKGIEVVYRDKAEWIEDINLLPENMRWAWRGPFYYMVPVGTEKATRDVIQELVDVGPITVIGATTDEALLPEPFYSRLSSLIVRLRPYTNEELAIIANNHAESLGVRLNADSALEIARRSRGTPRKVKQITERVVDWVVSVDGDGTVDKHDAQRVLATLGIDRYGLSKPHRDILDILRQAPAGLSRTSLAQMMRVPPRNLEMYWSELAEFGFVSIDTRHRITDAGRKAF